MNGFGTVSCGAGENVLLCTGGFDGRRAILCESVGGAGVGEAVGVCFSICAGMCIDFGNSCGSASVGPGESLEIALLFC